MWVEWVGVLKMFENAKKNDEILPAVKTHFLGHFFHETMPFWLSLLAAHAQIYWYYILHEE